MRVEVLVDQDNQSVKVFIDGTEVGSGDVLAEWVSVHGGGYEGVVAWEANRDVALEDLEGEGASEGLLAAVRVAYEDRTAMVRREYGD